MKNKKTITIRGTSYNIEKKAVKRDDTIIDVENEIVYVASIMDVNDIHWVVVPKSVK